MFSSYSEVYHNCSEDYIIEKRLDLVRYANEFGIKSASRHFKCSKNTIKRWSRRYLLQGKKGLYNHSRRPKRIVNQLDQETINQIAEVVISAEEKKKYITSVNVAKKLNITHCSYCTINRYVRRFMKTRRKARPKVFNKSIEFKKDLKPFELIQIDIKYLTDIDPLKPYFYDRNLAKYQITARDVYSGFPWVAYCFEKSVTSTTEFLKNSVYSFLKQVSKSSVKEFNIQTDNGFEFTNKHVRTKNVDKPVDTKFTEFILQHFNDHKLIVPGHCTSQSEVESFHWIIERDCLAWEDITDNETLIKHTTNFINEYRNKNKYKLDKSPIELINEYYDLKNIDLPKPIVIF